MDRSKKGNSDNSSGDCGGRRSRDVAGEVAVPGTKTLTTAPRPPAGSASEDFVSHYRAKNARLKREASEILSKGMAMQRELAEESEPASMAAASVSASGGAKTAAGPSSGMQQRRHPVVNSGSGRTNATANGGGDGVKGPVSETEMKQWGATPPSLTTGDRKPGEKVKEKHVASDSAEASTAKKNGAAKAAWTNGTTDAEKKLAVADGGGAGAAARAGGGGNGNDGKKEAGDADGRKNYGNDGSAPQHRDPGNGSGTGASVAASSPAAEDAAVAAPSSPSSSSANASAAAAAAAAPSPSPSPAQHPGKRQQQQKPKSPPPTKRKYTKRRDREKGGVVVTKNAKVANKRPADAKSKPAKAGKRVATKAGGKAASSATRKSPTAAPPSTTTSGERRGKVVSLGVVGRNGHVVGSPAHVHVTGEAATSASGDDGGGGGAGGARPRKRARPDGVANMELDRAIAAEQQAYAMSMNARRSAAAAPPAPPMMMAAPPAAAAASSPPMMNGGNKAATASPSSPSASTVSDLALPFPVPQAASIAYSLAGPYVQGLINGNQSILETIEGDTETSVNEMTTKLLLSATDGAGSTSSGGCGEDSAPASSSCNAEESSTVTLSLSEMDNVAKEMVMDRRSATREAVQFAFVEMKKRHDTILDMYREQLCATVQREATKQKRVATMEHARTTNEIVRQLQSKHEAQVKKMKEDQAKLIKDMIKSHCEEVARLKDELDGVRSNHSRALDSYRMAANSQVLALCTKKKKKKKRAVVR